MGLSAATSNVLVSSVLAVLAVAGIVLYVRRIRSAFHGSLKEVVAECARIPSHVLGILANEDGDGDERLATHIGNEVTRRRMAYAKGFTSGANVLMISFALFIAWLALISHRENHVSNLQHEDDDHDAWCHWAIVIAGFTFLAIDAQPCLQKGHCGRSSHCFLMALLLLNTLPWSSQRVDEYYTWTKATAILGRLLLGFMQFETRVTMWTNLGFFVGVASCFHEIEPSKQTIFLASELVTVIGLIITMLCFEVNLISSSTRDVKERAKQGQHSAVTSLLSMVCDAVVELDGELCIAGDCLGLANALFHSQAKALLGTSLKQLVVEEDHLSFEDHMVCHDKAAMQPVNMFHVKLRDCWGNAVPMELFHVPYCGMGEEMRHLVGLREHSDSPNGVPADMQDSPPGSKDFVHGARRSLIGHGSVTELPDAGLQVDVLAADPMEITYSSPKFKREYGSVGTLEELLPQPQEFRQWLMSTADAVWDSSQGQQDHDFGGLVLGKHHPQFRMVKALFVDTHASDASDRSTYRVSIKIGDRLSGRTDGSSISSSSSNHGMSLGTPARLEHLSFGHAQQEAIQAGPAQGLGETVLALDIAQPGIARRQAIAPSSDCIVRM